MALAEYVSEPAVRQFLLKNLQRNPEGGFGWKMNLEAISRHISSVGDAVEKDIPCHGPVLFVRGARSNYVTDNDIEGIKTRVPMARLLTMETGQWVQSEKPAEVGDAVTAVLRENENA